MSDEISSKVETLSVGCGAYDRTWPLIAGQVTIEGIQLDWSVAQPEELFLRGMLGREFHVTEMSFSTYLVQLGRGENAYKALPVFVSRKFRHGAIFVRSDAGIDSPGDLRGRRIGVPEYQLTANVWARGLLSDEYGVRVEDVEWLIGDTDMPGREEKVPLQLPDRIRTRRIGADETLWQLMQRGEVDAVIAPRVPAAYRARDPRIRALFSDVKAAEQAYFRKSGIFPIMHLVGVRNDVLDRAPEIAGKLYDGFERARRHAVAELHQGAYDAVMLPWQDDHVRETEQTMGAEYWTYGVDRNASAIEAMLRYAFEQGLIPRRFDASEIFIDIGA